MPPLWQPGADRVSRSHLTAFTRQVESATGRSFPRYEDLHHWSVEHAPDFWAEFWDYCGVIGDRGEPNATDMDRMPGATFFPKGRLNFAENLLRRRDDQPAIIATTENGRALTLTFKEVYREQLDAAPWDAAEQERVIDEVLLAYRFNTELFEDLARAKQSQVA